MGCRRAARARPGRSDSDADRVQLEADFVLPDHFLPGGPTTPERRVDGGTMGGVTISNVVMRDVPAPLFVRLGNRGRDQEGATPGRLRNGVISNVMAIGATDTSSIVGLPGHPIEGVTIADRTPRSPQMIRGPWSDRGKRSLSRIRARGLPLGTKRASGSVRGSTVAIDDGVA